MKTFYNHLRKCKSVLFLLGMLFGSSTMLFGQSAEQNYETYKPFFEAAYAKYADLPRGVLEGVAFTYNRFAPPYYKDTVEADVHTMPHTYGVMGLTLHGKGVFRENLRYVAQLARCSVESLLQSDSVSVMAYAAAFASLQRHYGIRSVRMRDYLPILTDLSELPKISPDSGNFALNSSLYAICWAMRHLDSTIADFQSVPIDFQEIFGNRLSFIHPESNCFSVVQSRQAESTDYSDARWIPAAACNYSSGRAYSITNVTVHYTQGTYSGAIAWFQNCSASSSAHYIIRSFDGQVTQMVREQDKAWHVGSSNGYTIGIEHEAYGNIASFFTDAMYNSSANLVRDICQRRPAISTHHCFYRDTLDNGTVLNVGLHSQGGRTACTQIRGHQHYPEQTHTDPGPYWNWNYYYKLLNPSTPVTMLSAQSGTLTDDGGASGNYSDNSRQLYLIDVADADSIALNFSVFDLETDKDFIWIYRGETPFSPLVGRWNTHSPGRVVVSGGQMLVEFRSDCSGNAAGWIAQWQAYPSSSVVTDVAPPTTAILLDETKWITKNFVARFQDDDNVQVGQRFYQIMEKKSGRWTAAASNGFLCNNFDNAAALDDWTHPASWQVRNYALTQTDTAASFCATSTPLAACAYESHLYDFYLTFTSGKSSSFYWDCSEGDLNSSGWSGYQLKVNKNTNSLDVYRIENGIAVLLVHRKNVYHTFGQSYRYRVVWNRVERRVQVFRHSTRLADVCIGAGSDAWSSAYVGFATDSSAVSVDNLRAYASRADSVAITVGGGNQKMITAQAQAGVATCKLKSVVMDTAGNFSSIIEKSLKVDYTPPAAPRNVLLYLSDGNTSNVTETVAQWNGCGDSQSGIMKYVYQFQIIGGSDAASRVKWYDNGLQTAATHSLRLAVGDRVRIMVKSCDNAGNESATACSRYVMKTVNRVAKALRGSPGSPVICEYFSLTGQLMLRKWFYDSQEVVEFYGLLYGLPAGVYVLRISQDGKVVQTRKCVVP